MDDEFDIEDEEEQELEDTDYDDGEISTMDKITNFMKENKKLVIIGVLVIVLLLLMSLFSSSNSDDGVTISQKELTITTETSGQLNLLKDGKNVTNVQWESKDPSIATVDKNGIVKGVKVGKTTVTGTYNKRKHECEVTVTEGDTSIKVETVTISNEGIILMPVGATYEVPIQVTPSNAFVKSKIFSSSEPNVASIDMETGMLTANAIGETTIRVSVNDGEAQTNIKARVINGQIVPGIYVLPTSLSFEEKEITLTEGETRMLAYRQEPTTASTDYILWTSSDEEIATVFNGELVARKAGNVEISISSLDLRDTMVVHVLAGEVPVTGINLESETNITMEVGEQKQIIATVEPSNATNQVITYLVDNPTVLSVDSSGTISAFGSGSTVITVSPSSNLEIKRLIYVTVNEPYSPPDDPTDPGGGDPTPKVGSVVITGTNNAVSTDVNGNEVDNTKITLSGSGNVDEIRFCFYNKATSSTCNYSIYTDEFNLPPSNVTAKTTYVIKAVPYYQGQEGTEVTRYVIIKGSGGETTPTQGYKITTNNLYNNQGTAYSYGRTGDQTVTFDIVNGGVSYLKVCLGDNCTPSTKVLDNGSYSITTRGMITVRVSEYNASNTLVRGPDTWYVYITDSSSTNACYCNSSTGQCRWGISGNGYTALASSLGQNACNAYINRGNVGCFLHNGNYAWGSHMTKTGYSYVSTITRQEDCKSTTPTPTSGCYCNASGECIWGVKDSTHTNDVTSTVGENACKAYINRGNKGCFRYNSSTLYYWGSYLGKTSYVLMSSYTTATSCPSKYELRDTSSNVISSSISMTEGTNKQVYLYVNGVKKTSDVTWTSSKKAVAIAPNGLIGAGSAGTARITATYNGKSTYVDVTVTANTDTYEFRNANNIGVHSTITMLKGTQQQLYLYVNGTKKTSGVTWSSNKTSVATVSSGLIKAVGAGTVRITATYNGKSIYLDMEVADPQITVGTITITGNGLTTTKPTTSSSSVSATTIKATKTGNVNKIKYCHTTGTTCTPSTEVSIGSSEVTILSNFSTDGIHTFIFVPYYNTEAGTKVTRYVYIKKPKTDPICPTLTSYSGTKDGNSHTITVTGGSGGTIEYRTSTTESWSTTKPTRKDTGTTTVYVRVKGDSTHNDKTCGSATIKITEPATVKCGVGSYYSGGKCLSCPSGYRQYTLNGRVTEAVITQSMLSGRTGSFKTKYKDLYDGNNYFPILQADDAKYVSQCLIEVPSGMALTFIGPDAAATKTPYYCDKGYYASDTRYVRYGSSSGCTQCPSGTTTTGRGSKSINDCN